VANNTESKCREILIRTGIREDQVVLDFGCGSGNYSIPAAKIVRDKGKVYALDKDAYKLRELARRAKSDGLNNIETIETGGEPNSGLEDSSVDAVLLYDIFWYFPVTDPTLARLLKEAYRVLRDDGLLSVFPEHVEIEELRQEIERTGFRLQNRFSGQLIHDGSPEQGQILNFRKTKENERSSFQVNSNSVRAKKTSTIET
jgi:ubiquinone/menaquinone biosynthesis C-methylase UbiE